MRTALRLAVAIAMAASVAAAAPDTQAPDPGARQIFRSAVDVVSIQASVKDGKGRTVQGLTSGDFEVRDNGELRPVLSLRADRQSPLSLVVLVDMSGSMRMSPKAAMAREAFLSLLAQLRPGEDEVALFTFDSSLHERRNFTSDLAGLRNALDDFHPFGTTSLYDATAKTARRLSERIGGHKAVVVLTDGIDTSSTLTAPEVSGIASSIDVPVYVVATVPAIDQRVMLDATERTTSSNAADLRDLADWTGGRLAFASNSMETTTLTTTLVEELRLQYVLSIEASSAREWRRLDIRVHHPSAVVRARSGYFGG